MISIDGKTKVIGLIGDPVGHSLSPAMHNAAFRQRGLNFCYLPFRVQTSSLPDALKAMAALGIRGLNVTAPHKEGVLPYLGELSKVARFLGAVNTIKNEGSKLRGYNTDVDGFLYLLRNNLKSGGNGERVLMLGAGGAAKAATLALIKTGVRSIVIMNRTLARAEELSNLLITCGELKGQKVETAALHPENVLKYMGAATLIVNALSGDPHEMGLLPRAGLPGASCAIDLRYYPLETAFLRWAISSGCRGINGIDMLLGQGARAFEIFTGAKEAPRSVMKEALFKAIAR